MAQTGTYWKMPARTGSLQRTGSLTTVLFVKTALSAAQEIICFQNFHSKSRFAFGKED